MSTCDLGIDMLFKLAKAALILISVSSGMAHADNIIRQFAPIKAVHNGAVPTAPEEPATTGNNGRYWRLWFTSNNGSPSNYVGLQELELHAQVGGADLTSPNTTITASSYYANDDLRPLKAIDNNFGDYYHAFWLTASDASFPHWLALDLGADTKVAEIALWPQYWQNGLSRSPKDFEIQASEDGSTWHTVKAVTGLTNWQVGVPQIIELN